MKKPKISRHTSNYRSPRTFYCTRGPKDQPQVRRLTNYARFVDENPCRSTRIAPAKMCASGEYQFGGFFESHQIIVCLKDSLYWELLDSEF